MKNSQEHTAPDIPDCLGTVRVADEDIHHPQHRWWVGVPNGVKRRGKPDRYFQFFTQIDLLFRNLLYIDDVTATISTLSGGLYVLQDPCNSNSHFNTIYNFSLFCQSKQYPGPGVY